MTNSLDTKYIETLKTILDTGTTKSDRTGTGTINVFGLEIRHNLAEGFPLLTTKKVHFKSVVHELLFFLSGSTNTSYLEQHNVKIWKEWQDLNGNLGPVYSHQWRNAGGKHKNRVQPMPAFKPTKERSTIPLNEIDSKLYITWKSIVSRCYNTNKDNYKYYGGRGVYLCTRWLTATNFISDAKLIDGWNDKIKDWDNFQIDKDIAGDGFSYSPQTCIWVSKELNMQARTNKIYQLVHENGNTEEVTNPTVFRKLHSISQGNFDSMLRGNRNKAGGWSLISVTDLDEGQDQILNLIKNLKTNPDSRRLLVDAWNVPDLPYMALPPCHYSFQCYVADNKLSMIVNQRSADMFLGVPFNIASYALLTHMLAQICELEVGELIWRGGDCHIYLNHIDQVNKQIGRHSRGEVYPLPSIELDKDIMDIDDFTYEDITLCNYQSGSSIKGDVSV